MTIQLFILVSLVMPSGFYFLQLTAKFFYDYLLQVISASGAVKHEDVVEQVKKLFTKLSANPITTSQLVEKEPALFTGSEVCITDLSGLSSDILISNVPLILIIKY